MIKLNQTVTDLPSSGIRRFFDLVLSAGPDVISLGVGEPDFSTPWHIREASIFGLEKGFTSYTENAGLLELREAVSQKIHSETSTTFRPQDEILITNGVSEGMDLALRVTLRPGEKILVPDPGYVMYDPLIKLAGGKSIFYDPLNLKKSLAKIPDNTKAIILNFPGNPLGNIFVQEDLEFIVKISKEKNLVIVSDEIYGGLSFTQSHKSILTIPGAQERTLLFDGLSKTHAMTGLRIGWVTGPAYIIEQMTKIHQYSALCACSISQLAAVEALRRGQNEADKMKENFNKRRIFCIEQLNNMQLPCLPPQGAFYIFADISKSKLDDVTFCERLLSEQKLAVIPGSTFGQSGKNHIRMTYASSLQELTEAMKRLEKFWTSVARK